MLSTCLVRRASRRLAAFSERWRVVVLGAAGAFLLCGGVAAATATFWTVSTQADFLKGDVENLSIDSDGRVFLGPSASLVAETAAPFLWTVLAGADGTLWAGSGNEGQVLKVGKDGKMSTFFDAAELEVHALAPRPTAGSTSRRRPTGRSTGRRGRHVEDILRS